MITVWESINVESCFSIAASTINLNDLAVTEIPSFVGPSVKINANSHSLHLAMILSLINQPAEISSVVVGVWMNLD